MATLDRAPVVLVLAAGRGERFIASGGAGSKLQAQLAGRTVLEHTLAAVRASGLPHHLEQGVHAGMGDSIAAAVRATRDAPGWLVLPGDLPLVQASTLQAVAAALAEGCIVVPVHAGEAGHPVGFPAACGDALAALAGPRGAAAIVAAGRVHRLSTPDAGTVTDVDTLAQLRQAEALLRRRSAPA